MKIEILKRFMIGMVVMWRRKNEKNNYKNYN